ncbi:MAG: class I SAM-dependent RNA methyltransferase, partial [Clostridiales bacterium]|nr:class I SAM-dependent RNA methyltransferase [Clostridiales bacterium]
MSFFNGRFKILNCVASGIEAVAKRELVSLGYPDVPAANGRLAFEGDLRDVARLNMFLRTVNRVRISVDSFFADTFDDLFDAVYSISWESIIPRDGKITVTA